MTAGYMVLVLAATYPTILELGLDTLGEPGLDKQNHLWDFWWWYQAARDPARSFFFTDLLFYPPGVSLWHANSGFTLFFFGLIPQALGFNMEATYDLVVLASLLITCAGGYVLGVKLFGDRGVGFVCGVLAAFNPLVIHNINLALIEFVNLGFALLFVAALHCLVARASWRDAILTVIWFMLAASWAWYMGLLLVIFTGIYVPVTLGIRGALQHRSRSLMVAGTLLAMGLFLLPFYLKIGVGSVEQRTARVEDQLVQAMAGERTRVVDKAEFLAPLAARLKIKDQLCVQAFEVKMITSIDPVTAATSIDISENQGMAPFFPLRWAVPLLMATLALVSRPSRWIMACWAIAIFSLLMSLGPCLVSNGQIIWDSCGFMPFSLLDGVVPGLHRVQFPQRLLFLGVFALVMLMGQGLQGLLKGRGVGRGRRVGLLLTCTALILYSGLTAGVFPISRGELKVPDFYKQEAKLSRGRAIVEVPLSRGRGVSRPTAASLFTFYQTVHGQPIYNGPIPEYLSSNAYPADIENNALLRRIMLLEEGPPFPPPRAGSRGKVSQGMDTLIRHGFKHILVHDDALTPETASAIKDFSLSVSSPSAKTAP